MVFILFFRFVMALLAYGIILNAVNIPGDLYVKAFLFAVMRVIGLCTCYTVDIPVLGRRLNTFICTATSGVCLLLMLVIPKGKSISYVSLS